MPELVRSEKPTCPKGDANCPVKYSLKKVGWYCYRHKITVERVNNAPPPRPALEPIPPMLVEGWHEALMRSPTLMQYLIRDRLLTEETIRKLRLGNDGGQIVIPVCDAAGRIVQIKHAPPGEKLKARKDRGSHLFPRPVRGPVVYLFEGEWDTLLARSWGLNAYCGTAGAESFELAWAQEIAAAASEVVVCYDTDLAGRRGNLLVTSRLQEAGVPARAIKLVYLPLPGTAQSKDLTDFARMGYGRPEFEAVVAKSRPPGLRAPVGCDDANPPAEVSLPEAGTPDRAGQWAIFDAVLVAKATDPYQLPTELKMHCTRDFGDRACRYCGVYERYAELPAEHDPTQQLVTTDESYLQLLGARKADLWTAIRHLIRVPSKCDRLTLTTTKAVNVFEGRITDTFRATAGESPVERQAVMIGVDLKPNATYTMKARTLSHPRDQTLTHVVHEARSLDALTEGFKVDKALLKGLPRKGAIDTRLRTLADDASRITGIWDRPDLHLAVLLTECSTLFLQPDPETQIRGWLDGLVIGDTGQGKTTVVERLIQWTGLGERVSVERTSIGGLTVGAFKVNGRMYLSWGLLPQHDRKFLVLEEAQSMLPEVRQELTNTRSEGIASANFTGLSAKQRAHARTRLLLLANDQEMLTRRGYGILAVPEFWGRPEDVRRNDFALIVAGGEVASTVVARERSEPPALLTRERLKHLILRAWAQPFVDIPREVRAEAAKQVEYIGTRFDASIALVRPEDLRWKLVRIAQAAANLLGDDAVTPKHVEWAALWLDRIYSTQACGFLEYSAIERMRYEILDPESIALLIRGTKNARASIELLLARNAFKQQDFTDFVGGDPNQAGVMRSKLVLHRCLALEKGTYYKTEGFVKFLRELLRETPKEASHGRV